MKEFFLDLLYQLDKLAGIQQMNKLLALREEDSRREINELLEILCRTSDQFPLIPKNDQKSIIRHAVVSDGDFIGLNAKFVYKSLNAHRDRYFREAAHIPDEHDPNWKPLEGEDRQRWLSKWMDALNKMQDNFSTKTHVQELVGKLPPKEKGVSYPSTPPEVADEIQQRILSHRIRYLREKYPTATDEEIQKLLERL